MARHTETPAAAAAKPPPATSAPSSATRAGPGREGGAAEGERGRGLAEAAVSRPGHTLSSPLGAQPWALQAGALPGRTQLQRPGTGHVRRGSGRDVQWSPDRWRGVPAGMVPPLRVLRGDV